MTAARQEAASSEPGRGCAAGEGPPITVRFAQWETDEPLIRSVRETVFVVEQKVPAEIDFDGSDVGCGHALAFEGDLPVGTARLGPEGRIGRMAVLQSHRRRGVGTQLLNLLLELARERGLDAVHLNSQTHANAFYESFGFVPEGEEFFEAGISHIQMTRNLTKPS